MDNRVTDASDEGRVAWIDMAKGICIILVVMMHSTLGTGEAMGGTGFLHTVVAWAKPFRMPDFFLVSGLFLSRVIDRPWRSYLDKKVVHFAYFYVLWVAIQAAFKLPPALLHGDLAAIEPFALAVIEPFGTLWFIYLLPVFFVVTRLLRGLPAPVLLAVGAALETARVHTGWTVPDEFAARWVYFLAGWIFAPAVFSLAQAAARRPLLALAGLVVWFDVETLAVITPVSFLKDTTVSMLPGVSLVLGMAGALAIVTISSLLAASGRAGLLRTCGRHSIVIYLAFFLPMAITRGLIVKSGLALGIGWSSVIVTMVGLAVPLLIHRVVRGTPLRWLFERPAWAKLGQPAPRLVPAE
ncbi:acyltransferase family protein [uncultured Alsobacter sp.]|uniref:acyltransferase family protein n=1 Tax=uncultured Alsobacter sp. TaxID=1748258 RepID=UPI0025DA0293|nr:acyltransferase family protein [uncultured Alsobacter sp.]